MPEAQRWSWGALEIWVKGRCLTRSVRRDGSCSDAVTWYMLPVLQWVLRRGAALVNEEPFPAHVEDEVANGADWLELSERPPFTPLPDEEDRWFDERSDWFQRHALRAAADGGVFPHIVLRRLGDGIEVSWDNERRPATRHDIRFVEPYGAAVVPASIVSDALGAFARDIAAAIAARAQGAGDLVDAAANLGASSEDWRWLMPRLVADMLDRSPRHADIAEELRHAAMDARRGLMVSHTRASYLLRAAPPSSDPDMLARIVALANRQPVAATPNGTLLGARRPAPAPAKEPWRSGYEAALELRDLLEWGNDPAPPLKPFLRNEGVDVVEQELEASIAGGILCTAGSKPVIIRNEAGSGWIATRPGTSIAHELAHLLLDAPLDHDFAVLSTPWAHWPSEARANAFAVMLLMPEGAVRRVVAQHGAVTAEAVKELMQTFDLGPKATTWHLHNLRFMSEEARLDLLQRLHLAAHP
jgi:hypothetical protein